MEREGWGVRFVATNRVEATLRIWNRWTASSLDNVWDGVSWKPTDSEEWRAFRPEGEARGIGFARKFVGNVNESFHFDPWVVRQEFLDLKTEGDALKFFERYGPFEFSESDEPEFWEEDEGEFCVEKPVKEGEPKFFALSRLKEWQEVYAEALLEPLSTWKNPPRWGGRDQRFEDYKEVVRRSFKLNNYRSPQLLWHISEEPFLYAVEKSVSRAIYATILIDKLAKLKFARCEKCKTPFQLGRQLTRKYCKPDVCGPATRKQTWRESQRAKRAG